MVHIIASRTLPPHGADFVVECTCGASQSGRSLRAAERKHDRHVRALIAARTRIVGRI